MAGQSIPSLPDDPAVVRGMLPDGIAYYLVSDTGDKGLADFALVRKDGSAMECARMLDSLPRFSGRSPKAFLAGNGISPGRRWYVQDRDGDVVLKFRDVRLRAGDPVVDSLLLVFFDIIDSDRDSGGDAIIISGDIDRDAMLRKLKMMSLMIPSREWKPQRPAYSWNPVDTAAYSVYPSSNASMSLLTVEYRSPRTPEEYMPTALPSVAKRLSDEFSHLLGRRIARQCENDSILLAGMRYNYLRSAGHRGDEVFSIVLQLRRGDELRAAESVGKVLSSLSAEGASPEEYFEARSVASHALYRNIHRSYIPNDEQVERCISSFLYGAAIAAPEGKARFYEKAEELDSTGLSLFNHFLAELLDRSSNLSVSCRTADAAEIPAASLAASFGKGWDASCVTPVPASSASDQSDTLRFPVPDEKCRIVRVRDRIFPGCSMWTFSNGMKVVYREMPTDGMLYYSLSLRTGFSSMRNMKNGEGAFLSDMPFLYDICGIPGDDFLNILAANGISMTPSVSLSGMSFSGSLPEEHASLLMKSLLALSGGMSFDSEEAGRYVASERLRLTTRRGELFAKLFVLDSLMNGNDRYSAFKSPENLQDDLPERALQLFRTAFAKADDGVLIFVGDIPGYEFKKFLQQYMGGFRTIRRRALKPVVSWNSVSGESTYIVEGQFPGIDVLMSADIPLNPANFMATRIVSFALKDALTEVMCGSGITVSVKDMFLAYPYEKFQVAVSVLPSTGIAASVETRPDFIQVLLDIRSAVADLADNPLPEDRLDLYRKMAADRWDSLQDDPDYWISMISGRFSGGKDLQTGYSASISAVTASEVQEIFRKIDTGSRIEYVTKRRYETRSDNTDR